MRYLLFPAISMFPLSLGCAEELGPEHRPTTLVHGSIRIAGRPVTTGWVEFLPIDGTLGDLSSAPILLDGTYSTDRAPVGRVLIALLNVSTRPIRTDLGDIDPRIFRSWTSPTRRSILGGESTRIDLDLSAEARNYLLARTQPGRPRSE